MRPKKLSKLLILIIELALLIVVRAACSIDSLQRGVANHAIYKSNFTLSIVKEVYNFIKHVGGHTGK